MSIQVDGEKALEAAMTQIERQFGKGSIMKLGSQAVLDVPVISTGSLALDKKTRNGFAILNIAFINHFHETFAKQPFLPDFCVRLKF